MNLKCVLSLSLLLVCTHLFSQTTLSGRIADANNKPVAGAIIKVSNTALGAKSDENGNYKLTFSQEGKYQFIVSALSYEKDSFEINILKGYAMTKNILLESRNKKVREVNIVGQRNKSSETALIAEQKASIVVKETMGAQEMSRKGASDAAAAVTKMSGISKEEGSSQIFVRGLGDRYNTTTLNGMFLPSDNPEFKNISLEYFPIDIIQSISVSKTYNNTLLGDFGGASIDIATKEYTGKPYLNLGLKTGFNTQAISHWNYGSGMSYLGTFDNIERPTNIEGKFVERDWQPQVRTAPRLNNEIHVDGGWSQSLSNKTKLSLYGTFTTSNKFQYFQGISRILYNDAEGTPKNNPVKTTYHYSTNQTGMINAVLQVTEKFKSKVNLLGFRTAGNQVSEYFGYNDGISRDVYRRRLINDISSMYITQWINEYKHSERLFIGVYTAWNRIENNQPNRLTTSLIRNNNQYQFLANNSGDHSSYYQNLLDNDYTINANSKIKLLVDSSANRDKLNINIGYTFRFKDRSFDQSDYIYRPRIASYPNINPDNIDEAFDYQNFTAGNFTMEDENPRNGKLDINKYTGDLTVHSPSIGIDYVPLDNVAINFGTRLDFIDQNVVWNIVTTYPNKGKVNFNTFKVLPFINFKYFIEKNHILKLGYSKTYTLPQFKELAPFLYYDISAYNTRGNPYLYASDNHNLDIKYEWYPSKSEIFGFGVFGKFIQNPINKVFEASAGADQMVFVNSGEQAIILGTEFELKKKIFDFTDRRDSGLKHALTGGFNISALFSSQDLNNLKVKRENKGYTSSIFSATNSTIQGASPLIFNIDLTYRMKCKNYEPQASLVFNYFFDRLYALGSQNNGEIYERGVPSLDLITKHRFSNRFSASANFRNILNPYIERYQVTPSDVKVNITSFQRGIDLSLGINYNF